MAEVEEMEGLSLTVQKLGIEVVVIVPVISHPTSMCGRGARRTEHRR